MYQNLSASEAQKIEIELIQQYDSIKNGYNVSIGGGLGGACFEMFEYNGIKYTSEDLAVMSPYNITGHDITNRVNEHGWSIERALNTPKGKRNITYEYHGKHYTIKQLYEMRLDKNLTYTQIKDRLCRNWNVERAISQSNNVKNQPFSVGTCKFEYQGKLYNSYELCQISSVEGLKPVDITTRINRHGWSVEKAITQPKKKRDIVYEYNGKKYTSKQLAELSPFPNITHHTITDRINRAGWTVEKAIFTPIQDKNEVA